MKLATIPRVDDSKLRRFHGDPTAIGLMNAAMPSLDELSGTLDGLRTKLRAIRDCL